MNESSMVSGQTEAASAAKDAPAATSIAARITTLKRSTKRFVAGWLIDR